MQKEEHRTPAISAICKTENVVLSSSPYCLKFVLSCVEKKLVLWH